MGASKRINTGNYTITTFKTNGNPLGNVKLDTHTLYVDGNLVVTGITTNVQAYDTILPIFHINSNLTVSDSPHAGLSGLENNRGSEVSVGLYWDESGSTAGQWIANNSVGDSGPILTSYNIKAQKTTSNPLGVSGYVVVTGNNAGGGGTGLFVNAGSSSSELVSVLTAKKYGIIFG